MNSCFAESTESSVHYVKEGLKQLSKTDGMLQSFGRSLIPDIVFVIFPMSLCPNGLLSLSNWNYNVLPKSG